MANKEHLAILQQGVAAWNAWRKEHPNIEPDFSEMDIDGSSFFEVIALQGSLNGAEHTFMDLRQINLSGTNLSGANFSGANLSGLDFNGVNLDGANLSGANLYGMNLDRANLSGVDLRGASLSMVKLREASLVNATMSLTIFANCDLSAAIGLPTVKYRGPVSIGVDTLYQSQGKIPESFLRGCGVPDALIEYLPSLFGATQSIQYYSCFISYSTKDEDFARRLHERMRAEHLRVWFAPEDIKGGEKLHEQIERAIQIHDRLLLVLSEESIQSAWVQQELRRARRAELQSQRRKLFPIRLLDFEALQEWECPDSRTGSDLAEEVRQYFIPDFSDWKQHDAFERAFARLLRDLKATDAPPAPAHVATPSVSGQEDIARQQKLLATHRRTLAHYIDQLAIVGAAHARPEITHGIAEARANIARVKDILRTSGVAVADHPDDTAD
jgi:uncharacterized protein YjbI with pentapeptide repeats